MSFNPVSWKLLNLYFKDNPSFLINHHLESYNDFFKNGLPQLLKEKNPIHLFKNQERITIDKGGIIEIIFILPETSFL